MVHVIRVLLPLLSCLQYFLGGGTRIFGDSTHLHHEIFLGGGQNRHTSFRNTVDGSEIPNNHLGCKKNRT